MRLPVASAIWMANSATSVFPAPVGADTMTDCPASIARIASSWKSSSGNGYRARNCSSSSIIGHSTTGGRLGPRWPAAGLYSGGRAMIVFHVALTAAEDYLTRREAFWRSHIERAQGLRAGSILIGGGPSARALRPLDAAPPAGLAPGQVVLGARPSGGATSSGRRDCALVPS